MTDYLASADVWTVLDLIVAEFVSDPSSRACFDGRLIDRAIALSRGHRAHRNRLLRSTAGQTLIAVEDGPLAAQHGDQVWVTLAGVTHVGRVHLVSSNGRSLLLTFDEGGLALDWNDERATYFDMITGMQVVVTPYES